MRHTISKNVYSEFENLILSLDEEQVKQVSDFVKGVFFCEVTDDAMSPLIDCGDMVQVRRPFDTSSGSIAAVLLDGDMLLRKIARGESWLELHAENPAYETMRFEGEDVSRVSVLGVVKKIIKQA